MEIQHIKQIAITDYLQQQGYAPARVQGFHYWYYSSLRNERAPSFKVNTERNQWYDFGSGEHGDIIDLVCTLHRCSISEAIQHLCGTKQVAHQEFSFGGKRKFSICKRCFGMGNPQYVFQRMYCPKGDYNDKKRI